MDSLVISSPNYLVKKMGNLFHAQFVTLFLISFALFDFFSFPFTSSSDKPKVGFFKSLESRSSFAHAQLRENPG